MRVQTTAVPATKYLPERWHVKFTDDLGVPNNKTDRTFDRKMSSSSLDAALQFLQHHNMWFPKWGVRLIGPSLTKKGHVYEVVETEHG